MRYWVDLHDPTGQQFSETARWVHALPTGSWKHPIYGTIEVTTERIRRFAHNVKNKVRGTDLDIDYDHKMHNGKAAGWVKDAEERSDGLWLLVEWTKDAAEALKKGEYRYFSPEFKDKWVDPQGNEHKDVVFGGGLTNRPFLKDLVPINFSELSEEGDDMDEKLKKALIKRFSLAEDATEEQINAELAKEPSSTELLKVDLSKAEVDWADDGTGQVKIPGVEGTVKVKAPEPVKASEKDDDLKKLAETSPALKKMLDEREADRKRLEALETANRLSEVNTLLTDVDGAKFALPPAAKDKLREALLVAPKRLSDDITGAVQTILKDGLVELGQRTKGDQPDFTEGGGPVKQFSELVDAKMKVNEKLTYVDAITAVSEENPQLYSEYRAAILAGEGAEESEEV